MIGWKVVKKTGTGFKSAVVEGPWMCTYVINEPTEGHKGTPILAFSTRRQARALRGDADHGLRVFKAEMKNPRPQRQIAYPWSWDEFEKFWQDGRCRTTLSAPNGTLACDAITLLEPA